MTTAEYIAAFSPLLCVAATVAPLVLVAFVLSKMQRRREVKRMHEVRRAAGECLIEPSRPW